MPLIYVTSFTDDTSILLNTDQVILCTSVTNEHGSRLTRIHLTNSLMIDVQEGLTKIFLESSRGDRI